MLPCNFPIGQWVQTEITATGFRQRQVIVLSIVVILQLEMTFIVTLPTFDNFIA